MAATVLPRADWSASAFLRPIARGVRIAEPFNDPAFGAFASDDEVKNDEFPEGIADRLRAMSVQWQAHKGWMSVGWRPALVTVNRSPYVALFKTAFVIEAASRASAASLLR
jgi:hypothetical protein